MFWKRKRAMSPEQGFEAIMSLVGDVTVASAEGNLEKFDEVFAQLEAVVEATGVEVPGLQDRLAALKARTHDARRQIEDIDAALWTGDLERAKALMAEQEVMMCLDEEEDAVEGDELLAELADLVPSEGLAEPEDPYAEIAAGEPGALERLISSGVDLNEWGGPVPHTPLLAALDAPGRSAAQIGALIEAGADPTLTHYGGDNAISWAMGYHHQGSVTRESEVELIALLASHGIDLTNRIKGQWSTLHRAIIQGGPDQLAAYLAAGGPADIDSDKRLEPAMIAGVTTVMLASAKPESLRLLLDAGADARRKDRQKRTAVEFVSAMASAARARAREDDPWTVAHAEALETSLAMLNAHLAH